MSISTHRAGPADLDALAQLFDAYRRFYALYYAMDHQLIPWCAEQLLASEVEPDGGR